MGAACTKADNSARPQTRKEAFEVKEAVNAEPPSPTVPQQPQTQEVAASPEPKKESSTGKGDESLKNFVIGEGDGIYLLLLAEAGGTLLQMYAHEKPAASDDNLLLIQVKPPVYIHIKESRFTLQGGKRTLKMNVSAALKTKDGKQKVCEAALEFIRLGWVYSAYMHAFPQLEQSPLSFLYIQTEHHNPEDLTVQDGETFVVAAKEKLSLEGEEKLSLEGEEKPSLEGEAKESGEGADGGPSQGKANVTQRTRDPKRVAASPDQPLTVFGGNDEADAAQVAQPEGETKRVLKEVLVLRHSNPGMAFPSSRVKFVAVLPMTSAEAREAFKEGRVIGEADLADLKDAVTKHHGAVTGQAEGGVQ